MTRTFWAVMVPTPWECLTTNGQPHDPPAPGCCGLLPLFDTEREARDWAGDGAVVVPLEGDASAITDADPIDPIENLDTAILDHLRGRTRAHPMSSPHIRQLARMTEECQRGRLPYKVIQDRMKALRTAGRYEWRGPRERYVVLG